MTKTTLSHHPFGQIHALRIGQGPQLLIALHGFGDQAQMFVVLEKTLGQHYTIVAFDLPFHGQTKWSKADFDKQDLLDIIAQVLEKEGKTRFSLLGFSFGARLAQALLPQLAPQLEHLYLLSPDGINTRGLRIAARAPMWLRRRLPSLLRDPHWLLALARAARWLRLVSPVVQQFLARNLSRPERLHRTFGCWLAMGSCHLPPHDLKKNLRTAATPTDVFIGLHDPMLRPQKVRDFYKDLPNARVFWLDTGHRIVGETMANALAQAH
jgi:pimeloyl-ACP methyl ester carboxylesterase